MELLPRRTRCHDSRTSLYQRPGSSAWPVTNARPPPRPTRFDSRYPSVVTDAILPDTRKRPLQDGECAGMLRGTLGGVALSPRNGAIVVPAGTIPSGSGIFRGRKNSRHRAGGDEQDPLFRLFLGDRGGHDVRGAPLPDGRGEGSSPRAPRSPVARLLPVRRARLLFGDGGDAGGRQVFLPERVLGAPPRNRLPASAVEAPRGDAGARHRRFRAARRSPGGGPGGGEGEGALPRGGGDRRHRRHRFRLLPLRAYRRPGSLLLPASRRG